MATKVTRQIQAYRRGELSWEGLIDFLRHYPFKTPERFTSPDRPRDLYARNEWLDSQNLSEDGTWDEVVRARDTEDLTFEEYQEINRLV